MITISHLPKNARQGNVKRNDDKILLGTGILEAVEQVQKLTGREPYFRPLYPTGSEKKRLLDAMLLAVPR